jgi:hypothetical protein
VSHPSHRVVVVPWLRRPGGLILRDWLAITVGRTIFAWRPLRADELDHELEHVRQWGRHGVTFPFRYAGASFAARRAGKRWYHDNRFEEEARAAVTKRGTPTA